MIQIRDQKKMKRQIFKKLLLVFLILAMQIMLVSGTDQNALIRNLVEQRIEIMNAFFNGTLLEKDAAACFTRIYRRFTIIFKLISRLLHPIMFLFRR